MEEHSIKKPSGGSLLDALVKKPQQALSKAESTMHMHFITWKLEIYYIYTCMQVYNSK